MSVEKTIDIIFAGTDKVSGVVKDIGSSLDDLGTGLGDIASPFEKMTAAVGIAQLAIAGLATAGVIAAGNLEKETQRMVNALGLPAEEAEKFKDIARDAYSKAFVDDLTAAFDGVILAQQRFGDNADADIGKVVENAAKLEKTFGVDMNESMNAVSILMSSFGIDASDAFDLIADGYQKGLDGSGDFIQSITEYSSQFANGQATAGEFFSIMETGYQEGYLGADKAADAFKEFRVRIQDGSKLTSESLALIGLDNVKLQKNLQSGETTVFEVFNKIIGKIGETDDEQTQMIAGVGLMGTQFEDLGTKAVLALDGTKVKIEDVRNTMANITFEDFETKLVSAWRSAIGAVAGMPEWSEIGNKAAEVAGDVSKNFASVIGDYDFSPLMINFMDLWDEIGKIFTESDLDLTTIEGMENAIELAVGSIESLIDITKGQIDVIKPVLIGFVDLVKWFNELDSGTKELAGNIITIGTALGVVGGAVSLGAPLISGLGVLIGLLSGPVGLTIALGTVALALGTWLDDFEPMPESYFTKPRDLLNEFKDDIDLFPTEIETKLTAAIDEGASTQEVMEIIQEGIDITDQHFDLIFGEEGLTEIEEDLYAIPDEKPVMIKVDGEWVVLDELEKKLDELEDKQIELGVNISDSDVKSAKETIEVIVGEGDDSRIVSIEVEASGADEAKKKIDEIPSEKIVEIKIQGEIDTEIARIEAKAETVQAAFEWKAKVDISEAKAQADIITAAYGSVNEAISSTGDVISTSIDALAGLDTATEGSQKKWEIEKQLDIENELREKAFNLQEKLTDSQIEYMDAKTKQLEDGDASIQIDSTGLEPALEMIMWQIIEKVQVKANEEAADFLLGI